MRVFLATVIFAITFVTVAPARIAHHHHQTSFYRVQLHRIATAYHHPLLSQRVQWHAGRDGRPAKWCGWFMRQVFGAADRALNVARNWARWGRSAGGPQVGAVVVWRHHVGIIDGGPDGRGRWLVRSGNDGHAVRTRYRALGGAIAFRAP